MDHRVGQHVLIPALHFEHESPGLPLERVQRVQLHLSINGIGCTAPVLKPKLGRIEDIKHNLHRTMLLML